MELYNELLTALWALKLETKVSVYSGKQAGTLEVRSIGGNNWDQQDATQELAFNLHEQGFAVKFGSFYNINVRALVVTGRVAVQAVAA